MINDYVELDDLELKFEFLMNFTKLRNIRMV